MVPGLKRAFRFTPSPGARTFSIAHRCVRAGAVLLLSVTAVLGIGTSSASAYAPDPNLHPIEGYASELSVQPGQALNFYVSLPKNSDGSQRTNYTVQYVRYGAGGSDIPTTVLGPITETNGINQTYTATSYVDGAGWTPSFTLTVPADWTSGIYAAQLTDTAETSPELTTYFITFIVRSGPGNAKPIALLASTNTYQAYNFWPGGGGADQSGSFYADCAGQNARTKVSFLRPAPSAMPVSIHAMCGPSDPNVTYSRNDWQYFENVRTDHMVAGDVRIARWLEKQKYSYSVLTDWDIDRDFSANGKLTILDPTVTPALIIGTHNEYWSQPMYDALTQYVDKGGNLMVLGGNSLYRHVVIATDPVTGNRTIEDGPLWSAADRQKLLGIGGYNGLHPYCTSNLGEVSTSHWAYTTPLTVPTGVYMGGSGEMKTPSDQCTQTGNRAEAVGWETDYASVRFARSWAELAGINSVPNLADVFYFQRPSAGSVFLAGSITFGQSLIYDANSSAVMTKLIQNVLSRMNKPTFSDFTAGDPNFPSSAGKPDLLERRAGEDSLRIYRGLANEQFIPGGQILAPSGWGSYNLVLAVGDFDSDGASDILARDSAGQLHLYRGNGTGGFQAGTGGVIDSGWGTFDAVIAPGDWDGDGNPDLLARTPNGDLYLYRGNGRGGFYQGGRRIATGMAGATLIGAGDFDYNASGSLIRTPGKPDLLVRIDTTGELRLYHGNGAGFAGLYDVINHGWNGIVITSIGDFSSDSNPDILGCIPGTGEMRVYHGTGGTSSVTGYLQNGYTSLGTGWSCNTSLFAGVW